MNGRLYRGCTSLVLSWLITLPFTVSSSSPAAAQAPETKDFRDDFAGTSLRPEWTIVDQDKNRWALVDSDYLLLVLKDEKNKFCYKGAVPDRYEFIVKVFVTQRLGSDYMENAGGIGPKWEFFYVSIDNAKNEGLKLLISSMDMIKKETLVFRKTVGGDRADQSKQEDPYSEDEREYYLRIVKTGIEYIGYISHDGTSWTEVGKHHLPGFSGSPCFGGLSSPLYASRCISVF